MKSLYRKRPHPAQKGRLKDSNKMTESFETGGTEQDLELECDPRLRVWEIKLVLKLSYCDLLRYIYLYIKTSRTII